MNRRLILLADVRVKYKLVCTVGNVVDFLKARRLGHGRSIAHRRRRQSYVVLRARLGFAQLQYGQLIAQRTRVVIGCVSLRWLLFAVDQLRRFTVARACFGSTTGRTGLR